MLCAKFRVITSKIKECRRTFIQVLFQFALPLVTPRFANVLHEHTNVNCWFTGCQYCSLFFPLCYPQHYGLRAVLLLTFYLAIFRPFSPSSARFLPFLEFDITQRFHILQCIQLWIYSEFFIQEQKEGYGGTPILYGEAIWPPFMPPQAAECCSNKSPDVLLFFFFLFL